MVVILTGMQQLDYKKLLYKNNGRNKNKGLGPKIDLTAIVTNTSNESQQNNYSVSFDTKDVVVKKVFIYFYSIRSPLTPHLRFKLIFLNAMPKLFWKALDLASGTQKKTGKQLVVWSNVITKVTCENAPQHSSNSKLLQCYTAMDNKQC